MTLEFFRKNGIKTASVVQYPRAFTHDPLRVVGPRLAYLSEHDADRCVEHVNDFWSAFESELLRCSFALKKTLNRYLPSVFENISPVSGAVHCSLSLSLKSLLSKSDSEFITFRVRDSRQDVYQSFQINWLVEYQTEAKYRTAKARRRRAEKAQQAPHP